MKHLFTVLILAQVACPLWADDIYQYQDKNGTVVFTNKPVKNAKKINLPPITVYASPMTKKDFQAKSYTEPNGSNLSPAGIKQIYVKDKSANLGTNETGRRQILSEELAHERQGLEDAKSALKTAEQSMLPSEKNNPKQYHSRIQALQDAVTEHQKNIEILTAQLGN